MIRHSISIEEHPRHDPIPQTPIALASGFRAPTSPVSDFDYDTAYARNIGILTRREQNILRESRVALVGLGGLGGLYAHALARLGIGRFSLADGDRFELVNFNRQMGGNLATLGQNKARSIRTQILGINPDAQIEVWDRNLDEGNAEAFLKDADLVLDGIDMFAPKAHLTLMRMAREMNLYLTMSAPLGFSAASVIFHPAGMKAEDYFDWRHGQSREEQIVLFALGLAPSGLHVRDMDPDAIDLHRQIGPSNFGACLLCAGLIATEVIRILLRRPGGWYAPGFVQFDANRHRLAKGRLARGNRGLLQRFKKYRLMKLLKTRDSLRRD